jgi:polar amino acid transport system substrate-binding protein
MIGKRLLLLLGLTFCALGCAQASEALRAGTSADYPPLAFTQAGRIVGIEADLAAALAERLDRPIHFVELSWEELIPALEAGEIDLIMAGRSVTDARARRVAFTRPYLNLGQMALIRMADLGRFATPGALRRTDARVGFSEGTTGSRYAREHLANATLVPQEDVDQGVQALRSGAIEVFIHDAPTVWRIASAPGEEQLVGLFWSLTEERLAWAVKPDNQELLQALDQSLAEWEESGRLKAIVNRWIRVRVEVQPP